MMARRRAIELSIGGEDLAKLVSIARSRTEAASRVERARMLLAYREDPSFFAVGRALDVHHQTVQRCAERALAYGPMAALDDRPRPGKEPTITAEAKAWLGSLACRKAKDLGYPHEVWTTRLLARHAREHRPAEGHACLGKLVQGTVCKILNEQEVKPHKVRYYLERRDPEFKQKMAEVLCVYREVRLIKETAAAANQEPSDAVAIVSYDEKPGIQAIATTAPDLPPEPGRHATFARDHEYKRHGTVSLLAGHRSAHRPSPRSRQGPPPQPRIHRIPQAPRRRLSEPYGDQADPRQSFGAHLQGDQSLARQSACRSIRIHLHAQARLLAQSRRGFLLQARVSDGLVDVPPHRRHRLSADGGRASRQGRARGAPQLSARRLRASIERHPDRAESGAEASGRSRADPRPARLPRSAGALGGRRGHAANIPGARALWNALRGPLTRHMVGPEWGRRRRALWTTRP